MLHKLKAHYVSVMLLFGSAVCLGATAWLIMNSGGLVYFVTFHAPLHLQLAAASPAYHQPTLPTFDVRAKISQIKLSRAATLAVHVAVTPRQTTSAYLEVWVRGPNNREVYKYPANEDAAQPLRFASGRTEVFDEAYVVPVNAPPGKYAVSVSVVSPNRQVDYYSVHNFASFEVL